MLYKEGDWVWFVDKYGVDCLPVGSGMPMIDTSRRYFHDKPSVPAGRLHSLLSLAPTNNHTIISYDGDMIIYLCSFTNEEMHKVGEEVRDSIIYQMNPKYKHYGHMTKKLLDRNTIQFIKDRLEEQPMKADDKKVKSVITKFKIESDTITGTSLEKVDEEVIYEEPKMTQWKVSWIKPLTWDEEKDIFYSKGKGELKHEEFETTTENTLSAIWDAKRKHQDMYIYSVLKNNKLVANMLGPDHIDRKMLCTVNNFWWKMPNARMIKIKTERSDGVKLTLSVWAYNDADVQATIDERCQFPYTYISHEVYTIDEWREKIDGPSSKQPEKKSMPPKQEAVKKITNTPKKPFTYGTKAQRLAGKGKTRDQVLTKKRGPKKGKTIIIPEKTKVKARSLTDTERTIIDLKNASHPDYFRKTKGPKSPLNENKPPIKYNRSVNYTQLKAPKRIHLPLICMKDSKENVILRVHIFEAENNIKINSDRYSIVSKQEWKTWKKKDRKGEYNSGIQPGSAFMNRLNRMERRAKQQIAQNKNVYGAMPRTRIQKVVIKVPEVETKGMFKTRIHVWVPSFDVFDFTKKGEWTPDNVKGYIGSPIKIVKKVEKVLLEKERIYYDYIKSESTITKTIIHNSTYTDCTSMTTSGKSLRRHRKK